MFETLKKMNTQNDIVNHWKSIFESITSKSEIGWRHFFNGLLSNTWTSIQKMHYDSKPKDGENIHRWKRLVIKDFLELMRNLWQTRCGYIHAEKR